MSYHLSLELLFRTLPLTPELLAVREGVLSLSKPDASRRWSGSAEYATIDQRLLEQGALQSLLASAEEESVERVRQLHRTLNGALNALAEGRPRQALTELIECGEAAAAGSRWRDCVAYFAIVENIAREIDDSKALILATRRLGRSHLHMGETSRAAQQYVRSLTAAETADDRPGQVIARTGLGHVLSMVGRWREAEEQYAGALKLNADSEPQLHAQLAINLAVAAREQGRLDDAAQWIQDAAVHWDAMSDADRSAWWNGNGMLVLEQGSYGDARQLFQQALAAAPSHFDGAMILDNLAALALREGNPTEAEVLARQAEEVAIAGDAPRALTEVYIQLGRIMRARRDPNGVAFFEKALQLARDMGYVHAEATACAEYALFRGEAGDEEEAEGLRDAARNIFQQLGTDPLPRILRD